MSKGENEKKGGKEELEKLKMALGKMQRNARDNKVPMVVIFEGWDTYGMAEKVNSFIRALDPRGYELHFINGAVEGEKGRPFIWSYFHRMPAKGSIAIFDRSYYLRLVDDYYDTEKRGEFEEHLKDIRMMEEQHARECYAFVKIFLNMSKKDLKRRSEKEKDPCRVNMAIDGDYAEVYDEIKPIWQEVLDRTSYQFAPWHIVEDGNNEDVLLNVFQIVLDTVKPYLDNCAIMPVRSLNGNGAKKGRTYSLADQDMSGRLEQKEYRLQLKDMQDRLRELQCGLQQRERSMVLVFEGWDAAGKGGSIIRLTQELNPREYKVAPIGPPNDLERQHHYLWRFYRSMPKVGDITIFDRSWYGRVLVERVEKLASAEQLQHSYGEINEMERMLATSGAIIIKFWLHIDQEEQLRRFQERDQDPDKQWKLNDEDWRNRSHWDEYVAAVEEMIARTSTGSAPWIVVPSNDKYFSRITVLREVVERMEDELE